MLPKRIQKAFYPTPFPTLLGATSSLFFKVLLFSPSPHHRGSRAFQPLPAPSSQSMPQLSYLGKLECTINMAMTKAAGCTVDLDGIIMVSLWDALLLISGKAEEQCELVNRHRKLLGGLTVDPC